MNTLDNIMKFQEIIDSMLELRFVESILNKLIKDGYVSNYHILKKSKRTVTITKTGTSIKEPPAIELPRHYITFEGEVFCRNGGYSRAAELAKIEEHSLRLEKIERHKMEKKLKRLTGWAAFGTVGILVWQIIEWVVTRLDMVWCNCP